ncbi:MAG: PEP-CTERM sorting domain-containing protein [Nitrosomonadales bacterium]|nr:PEP-CTERM sorting domain-containing protein [Nitrosomonadales bacterium]
MRSNNFRRHGLAIALAGAALFAAQPAAADTIQLNGFWAASGSVNINFSGIDWHDGAFTSLSESGGSGGFRTYNLTTDPGKTNAFQSWCVDIFHSFSFVINALDVLKPANIALAGSSATLPTVFSQKAAADLGRLYTNHHAAIDLTTSSGTNQAAFQLAVWEIVNERSGAYSLTGGDFRASGTGSSTATTWLNELSTASVSQYDASIWTVQSVITSGKGYAQDVAVFSKIPPPVPEPEIYAMLLAGIGLLGVTARRRSRKD